MKGSEKQVKWAAELLGRLDDVAAFAADCESECAEEISALKRELEDAPAWVVIDKIKTISKDPEKACKQIRYFRGEGKKE